MHKGDVQKIFDLVSDKKRKIVFEISKGNYIQIIKIVWHYDWLTHAILKNKKEIILQDIDFSKIKEIIKIY